MWAYMHINICIYIYKEFIAILSFSTNYVVFDVSFQLYGCLM